MSGEKLSMTLAAVAAAFAVVATALLIAIAVIASRIGDCEVVLLASGTAALLVVAVISLVRERRS